MVCKEIKFYEQLRCIPYTTCNDNVCIGFNHVHASIPNTNWSTRDMLYILLVLSRLKSDTRYAKILFINEITSLSIIVSKKNYKG